MKNIHTAALSSDVSLRVRSAKYCHVNVGNLTNRFYFS